jgi:gas vesicle structural protein
MAVARRQQSSGRYLERPAPSGLAEVVDLILDKGLVIDAYVRVSLIGIELLTIDARIVIASVDTYLRFAQAVDRLQIEQSGDSETLPQMIEHMQESGAGSKVKGALEGVEEKFSETFRGDDEEEGEEQEQEQKQERGRSRSSSGSRRKREEE